MYVAIELVTKKDGTFSVSTYKKETRDEAEKAFHSILVVAATSTNLIHAAAMLNAEGQLIKCECYKHDIPDEPKEGEE